MSSRREFLKKSSLLSAGAGLLHSIHPAVAKALSINPELGSSFLDAEHIVFLMQENRSFDHTYGTLQGVRGFNDPMAINLPNNNKVWLQSNEKGEVYGPIRLDIKNTKATWMSSLPHSWTNQVDARNNGNYDKWLQFKNSDHKEYKNMPLTLGYHNREDIPFYYALADAFTVCDQNFCSSLTGTTPNRLHFWSGTIRENQDSNSKANVWNEDADHNIMVSWKTFPERLEEHDISWKVYQNELYLPVGFEGEEEGWLSNFGDNPLEYFTQYNAKLSLAYIDNLPKDIGKIKQKILQEETVFTGKAVETADGKKIFKKIEELKKQLQAKEHDAKIFTREKFDSLSEREKNLHNKAFCTNSKNPDYNKLKSFKYKDNDIEREMLIPKADVLHKFREDVNSNKLPTVSWIVAPENFSDHPSSAWYGAWYISEVMNILTKNPDVWKKTIFVLTYDENDGYFDHVPPFVPPHPNGSDGFCSKGINTALEYVSNEAQQTYKGKHSRISPIGLGYRVPLVIASPWSRGGWVNSEVFDHTSSLRFLEHFLFHKTGKQIAETNISAWRRAVCGNLTSVFRKYNGEKIKFPEQVDKEKFIEEIHKAKFKNAPSGHRSLSEMEIADVNKNALKSLYIPKQEKGTRMSSALFYELYAHCNFDKKQKTVSVCMNASNAMFGKNALGSPFQIYIARKYKNEIGKNFNYTVSAADTLCDVWKISDFENSKYHLRLHAPNGFFREFMGGINDPEIEISLKYGVTRFLPNVLPTVEIKIKNNGAKPLTVELASKAYTKFKQAINVAPNSSSNYKLDLQKSNGWYYFSIIEKGNKDFLQTFAGRVETGKSSKTDPLMGLIDF